MSIYKIVSTYRSGIIRYNSPIFYVEAVNNISAIQIGKQKSGLSKFLEWSFSAFEININNNKNKKK